MAPSLRGWQRAYAHGMHVPLLRTPCKYNKLSVSLSIQALPAGRNGSNSQSAESRHEERNIADGRLQGFPSALDKDIAKMAVPSLATVLLDPLLGAVDTAIVGHLGGEVLAGVGLGALLAGATNWLFSFLSILTIPRIAECMAKNDKKGAVEHVGQALWIASVVGFGTLFLLHSQAPNLVQLVGGEPAMMANAVAYMQARCLGNPAVLSNFVFIGALRGLKDAKTPLYAAIIANICNLLMDVLFVYGLHMGAGGAALATAISQWLSCSIMFGVLLRRGIVQWKAFSQGPKRHVLQPFLLQGFAVSFRTIAVMSVIMASSAILARVGAVSQAAHEILRQTWIICYQFAECLNISNQSLVASAVGMHDLPFAVEVAKRHLWYAVGLFTCAGLVVLTFKQTILGTFTSDAAVIATAATALPLVVACFPLDAMTSIFDGTLTACGQAAYSARSTTSAALLVVGVMLGVTHLVPMTLFRVWCCMKLMTFLRLPMLVHRVFHSDKSPFAEFLQPPPKVDALPLQRVTQPAQA